MTLAIYDVMGREIFFFYKEAKYGVGEFEVIWNGMNKYGEPVSSGTYIIKLKTGTSVVT